ncbi:ATP-binding cassette domain-containing protein [Acidimicrobiaceae bacterium USS-CC1]|uniref:ATP-binding cassette domain-containing protein n=1 Tax=Acidiferrimicrobium australe TaxID=2664430 RepID=A0ABW9QWI0_9ACTN|nr:ATP-binding cassette domain-containing protein [Acidiferrimicrobium australe]
MRVEHLTRRYGTATVVDDVSFAVGRSEVLGLLGPNGAGKTTTIEILEGLRVPTAGAVRVLGRDPRRGGRRLRNEVGVVTQAVGTDATLTVAELVRLHASFYRPRRAAEEVIREVGLRDSAAMRVGRLSGGQRRRLDLALALVGFPSVLFLDEPTTGLDPGARRRTWAVIERLRRSGLAIVLTSHYLDEVQRLADRVVVLSRGRVVGEGPPGHLSGPTAPTATISFRLGGPVDLPPGPWESVSRAGGILVVETREPVEAARILLAWAAEARVDLDELEIRQPSLEEEYLRLTSHPRQP